jgi:VWFA-related protein
MTKRKSILNVLSSMRLLLLATFALFTLGLVRMHAQDGDGNVVRVTTELASFEVSVTDKNGEPVKNLTPADFRIIEDGVERKADFFAPISREDNGRPLAIVFTLDVSGSMTSAELVRLRQAMQGFIDRLSGYNAHLAITSFGMEVKTLQSFTNRPTRLDKTFSKLQGDGEGLSTHAYDAVDDAIRMLRKKSPQKINDRIPKRAVIVITDGFPVGDIVSPSTVIERANSFETSVYSVILPSFSRIQGNHNPLPTPLEASGLIQRTGGRSFYATDKNFDGLFKSLAEEMTSSYAIAFYPKDEHRQDGKFHEVRIESRLGLKIKQNRNGYLGRF